MSSTYAPQSVHAISASLSNVTSSNGNLGIGTTTPAYSLDITADARISGNMYLPNRPRAILRDTTQYGNNLTSNTLTLNSVLVNVGGVFNPTYNTRINFPMSVYYSVSGLVHIFYQGPSYSSTSLAFTNGDANKPYAGACVGTVGGFYGDQYIPFRWMGYLPAGAYCTVVTNCWTGNGVPSAPTLWNYNGMWNYVEVMMLSQ